jgi:uncharacterized protein YjbJ (UPF0337 family)
MMTSGIWDQIAGTWKQAKGKVRETWGDLTDDDLEEIAGKIQQRYGIAKEEANKQIDKWASELKF